MTYTSPSPHPAQNTHSNKVQNLRYIPKWNRNTILRKVNRNPVIRSDVTRKNGASPESVTDLRSHEDKNNSHNTYQKQQLAPHTFASTSLMCYVINAFYREYCKAILKETQFRKSGTILWYSHQQTTKQPYPAEVLPWSRGRWQHRHTQALTPMLHISLWAVCCYYAYFI